LIPEHALKCPKGKQLLSTLSDREELALHRIGPAWGNKNGKISSNLWPQVRNSFPFRQVSGFVRLRGGARN